MPLTEAESGEYLEGVELLLEGSPEGRDAALTQLVHRLETFVSTEDEEPAEITVRLLGTAVGGQSRVRPR